MDKRVTLELTLEEINTILAALQEMPYKIVSALLANVVNQANEQAAGLEEQEQEQEAE